MSGGSAFVPGVPRPQGSLKAFVVKAKAGPRAVVTASNAKVNPWRADVHAAVRAVIGDRIAIPEGSVCIALEFVMPRRAAEKRIAVAHTRKPDIDRLVRAALDSVTGLVMTDDAQVDVLGALKRTAEPGEQPGMRITWSAPHDAVSSGSEGSTSHQDAKGGRGTQGKNSRAVRRLSGTGNAKHARRQCSMSWQPTIGTLSDEDLYLAKITIAALGYDDVVAHIDALTVQLERARGIAVALEQGFAQVTKQLESASEALTGRYAGTWGHRYVTVELPEPPDDLDQYAIDGLKAEEAEAFTKAIGDE